LAFLDKKGMKGKQIMPKKAACGATWPRQRKFEAGLIDSPICLRCKAGPEDDFHRTWKCAANKNLDDERIRKSDHLQERALESEGKDNCFWCRGLVPKGWTKVEETNMEGKLEIGEEDWKGGHFYLDGSGGRNTSDKRTRKCGWAAVRMERRADMNPKPVQAICGILVGKTQTVPRAELTAAVELLKKHRGREGDITMFTDCNYVFLGSSKTAGAKRKGNGDLWHELKEEKILREKAGYKVDIFKVKAHGSLVDIEGEKITIEDFKGNALADAFAGEAAKLHQAQHQQIKDIARIDKEAWLVQNRIMATMEAAMNKEDDIQAMSEDDKEVIAKEKEEKKRKQRPKEKKKAKEDKEKMKDMSKTLRRLKVKRRMGHNMVHFYKYGKKGAKRKSDKGYWKCFNCLGVCTDANLDKWQEAGMCKRHHSLEEEEVFDCNHLGFEDGEQGDLGEGLRQQQQPQQVHTSKEALVKTSPEEEDVFGYNRMGVDDDEQGGREEGQSHLRQVQHEVAPEAPAQEPGGGALGDAAEGAKMVSEENAKKLQARERLAKLRASIKDKQTKEAAAVAAKAKEVAAKAKPAGVLRSQLHMGNVPIHSSHTLHYRQGIIWCWKCGAYGTEVPKKLTGECLGERTRGAEGFVSRLQQGLTPRKGMEWPLLVGQGPPEGPVLDG